MNWLKSHLSEKAVISVIASAVGLLSGVAAHLLKLMIGGVSSLLTSIFAAETINWWLLAIPLTGILLTQAFMQYVTRSVISHGVKRLMVSLKNKTYRLASYLLYAPMIASALTLGFGGSAGSEGPIAYTGAAIGSNVARWFRLRPDLVRVMVGCGAAAGIAGVFKAPIGGVLFALEVLRMEFTTMSVILLLVAALIASLTAYILSGGTMDIDFYMHIPLGFDAYPYVLALGLFCGAYSIYYSFIMKWVENRLDKAPNRWISAVLAGIILSCAVFIFPSMFGEGYEVIEKVINGAPSSVIDGFVVSGLPTGGWCPVLVSGGILLLKCFAASATTCGGVAGDFAPALFAGCIAGAFFASSLNLLFGLSLPVGLFALLGMAGVMAGAIRAPLMAIFLTVEMSAGYDYLLPLTLVGALSFGVVRLFTMDNFFNRGADRNNGIVSWLRTQLINSKKG